MSKQLRAILILFNAALVAFGLWYGLPSYRAKVPTSDRSADEVHAMVEKATDIDKLKRIIKSDDACIRADRELASLLRHAAVVGSAAGSIVGVVNILALSLGRKRSKPSQ
ncbi:MAG TPA: hypothetical protein VN673_06030 [Clostridia bacterium]|nr:hypothetical protein [Clostridia bacterium]